MLIYFEKLVRSNYRFGRMSFHNQKNNKVTNFLNMKGYEYYVRI